MAELKQITNGELQSAYHEFQIELAAGEMYPLINPFNYFRCLEASSSFEVAWGTSVGNTVFEAGLGIRFDDVISTAQIYAPKNQPLTVRIGCGIGLFDDSRLSVSGTVKTEQAQYASFVAATVTIADGTAIIPAAQKVLLQNTGANTIYLGGTGTDGLQLKPLGTFEYSSADALTVYGADGDTLAVGSFN